jgi:hypothetical protein
MRAKRAEWKGCNAARIHRGGKSISSFMFTATRPLSRAIFREGGKRGQPIGQAAPTVCAPDRDTA